MTTELLATDVRRRPATPGDRAFLLDLYASVRAAELAHLPWTGEQRAAFVRMQYDVQEAGYRRDHPHGQFDVVEVAGRSAGRLSVDHGTTDVRIVDIALLPELRGRGVGGMLLREVLDAAAATGRTVSLHVELTNRARSLYEGLGFVPVADDGLRLLLEWRAP